MVAISKRKSTGLDLDMLPEVFSYKPLSEIWFSKACEIYREATKKTRESMRADEQDHSIYEINAMVGAGYRALQQISRKGAFLCHTDEADQVVQNALILHMEKPGTSRSKDSGKKILYVADAFRKVTKGLVKQTYVTNKENETTTKYEKVDGYYVAIQGHILVNPTHKTMTFPEQEYPN
jgi:hypothetical protein